MTRDRIVKTAIKMANKNGLINLTCIDLCSVLEIPTGSFMHIVGCTFTEFINEIKPHCSTSRIHTVTNSRPNAELRKEQILNVAIEMAKIHGYQNLKRDAIANAAGVSMGLVTRYFKTMLQLKRAVMRAAILRKEVTIIAQGLAHGDNQARKAPESLKNKAARSLLN